MRSEQRIEPSGIRLGPLILGCFMDGGEAETAARGDNRENLPVGVSEKALDLLFRVVFTFQPVLFFFRHHFQLNEKIANTRFPQYIVF